MIAYVLLRVFVILLLVAANAFFAAAEFALVSVRETRIQQLIAAHRLGEPVLARLFEGWIGSVPYALIYAHATAVAVAFVMITCLHVILGELVPKSLALQRAERVALA